MSLACQKLFCSIVSDKTLAVDCYGEKHPTHRPVATSHDACDVLGLDAFNEDDLYLNLDWLAENQPRIEDQLFRSRYGKQQPELYLFDVTSSYLEGVCNELAAFGYNRDGKRGKMQVVYGMLCDPIGLPVSISAFKGNTTDTKTFGSQIPKVAQRFGGGAVTFVGDRGMIKGPQIEQLQAEKAHEFHYITAITKPQFETLLKQGVVQLELFDEEVAEVLVPLPLRSLTGQSWPSWPEWGSREPRSRTTGFEGSSGIPIGSV